MKSLGRQIANRFRWSKSRAAVFNFCRRKYYFRYYHHWGGWDAGAEPSVRLAYILGKMVSMPALVGTAVHDCLGRHFSALKNGQDRPLPPERPVEAMRRAWKAARDGLWKSNPKRYPPLFELYYDRLPPKEELREMADKARRAVTNLKESPLYARIRSLNREDIVWSDSPDSGFSEQSCFSVEPFEAIALPDLVFREGDDTVIVDWKTGRADDDDRLQMGAAAIWTAQRFAVPPGRIRAVNAYLDPGREEEFEIDDKLTNLAAKTIRGEMEAMAAYLSDRGKNLPAPMTEFPRVDNQRLCRWCEFQEICLDDGE